MAERILIVDDEPGILHALQRLLRHGLSAPDGSRYQVDECANGALALEQARRQVYALAISDYRMPEMNGVDFLTALRTLQPDCERIILSGYADLNALVRAVNEAAIARFIAKPWADFELLSAVRQVLQVRDLVIENRRLADLVRTQQGQRRQHRQPVIIIAFGLHQHDDQSHQRPCDDRPPYAPTPFAHAS